MKKLISMLLALTLVLALVPTVFAADGDVTYTPGNGFTIWGGNSANGELTVTPTVYAESIDLVGWSSISTVQCALDVDPITDRNVMVSFDFKREDGSAVLLKPWMNGVTNANNVKNLFPTAIVVDGEGNLYYGNNGADTSGTPKMKLEADKWYEFDLKYDQFTNAKNTTSVTVYVYVDGVNLGGFAYSNYVANYNGGIKGFLIQSAAVSSSLPSTMYKNMVITNVIPSEEELTKARITDVKNTSGKKILFTANKAFAPAKEDVTIAGYDVTDITYPTENSFEVTLNKAFDAWTASGVWGETAMLGSTVSYSIGAGEGVSPIEGTFEVTLPETLNDFNLGSGEVTSQDMANKINEVNEFMQGAGTAGKNFAVTEGRYEGEGDHALVWTGVEKGQTTVAYLDLNNNSVSRRSPKIVWFEGLGDEKVIKDTDFVISVDFKKGSNRVAVAPIALKYKTATAENILGFLSFYPDGVVYCYKKSGNRYLEAQLDITVGVNEWHNVTAHVSTHGTDNVVIDWYLDGELIQEDIQAMTGGYNGVFQIMTTMAITGVPTDATADLNNIDPARYDVVVMDNMYVGYDMDYKTSELILDAAGNAFSGAIARDGVAITASYTSDGDIKDVNLTSYNVPALTESNIATDVDAETGDTVKFMIVNDLINLKPLVAATSYVK